MAKKKAEATDKKTKEKTETKSAETNAAPAAGDAATGAQTEPAGEANAAAAEGETTGPAEDAAKPAGKAAKKKADEDPAKDAEEALEFLNDTLDKGFAGFKKQLLELFPGHSSVAIQTMNTHIDSALKMAKSHAAFINGPERVKLVKDLKS